MDYQKTGIVVSSLLGTGYILTNAASAQPSDSAFDGWGQESVEPETPSTPVPTPTPLPETPGETPEQPAAAPQPAANPSPTPVEEPAQPPAEPINEETVTGIGTERPPESEPSTLGWSGRAHYLGRVDAENIYQEFLGDVRLRQEDSALGAALRLRLGRHEYEPLTIEGPAPVNAEGTTFRGTRGQYGQLLLGPSFGNADGYLNVLLGATQMENGLWFSNPEITRNFSTGLSFLLPIEDRLELSGTGVYTTNASFKDMFGGAPYQNLLAEGDLRWNWGKGFSLVGSASLDWTRERNVGTQTVLDIFGGIQYAFPREDEQGNPLDPRVILLAGLTYQNGRVNLTDALGQTEVDLTGRFNIPEAGYEPRELSHIGARIELAYKIMQDIELWASGSYQFTDDEHLITDDARTGLPAHLMLGLRFRFGGEDHRVQPAFSGHSPYAPRTRGTSPIYGSRNTQDDIQ